MSTEINFNLDVILPAHPISENRSSHPVRVSFDGAEGQGRVWLMVAPEDNEDEPWIPIEGPANARELARLLNAWADAFTGEQP